MRYSSIKKRVDRIGEAQQQISALQAEIAQLKGQLLSAGITHSATDRFVFFTIDCEVTRVDYKGIVKYLEPSPQIVEQFTTVSDQRRVTCKAR